MSSSLNKKSPPVQLTVVKPGNSRPAFVGQDALSSDQLATVQNYISRCALQGVCVGALVGSERWDLRPLVIEKGALTLLRFTSPDAAFQKNFSSFQAYLSRVQSIGDLPSTIYFGSSEGQLWVRRRFYRNTLCECEGEIRKESKHDRLQRLSQIVEQVKRLHSYGMFHGHIAPSNIAWYEQNAVLLDYGFASFKASGRETKPSDAPELNSGAFGPHTDLFGLGMLMATLFAEELSPEEERFVDSLLSPNPSLRPTILQMEDFLGYRLRDSRPKQKTKPAVIRLTDPIEIDPAIDLDATQIISPEDLRRLTYKPAEPVSAHTAEHKQSVPGFELPAKLLAGMIMVFLAAYIFAYKMFFSAEVPDLQPVIEAPAELWHSGQPSLMQQVARAAVVQKDRLAQAVIIQDSLAGSQPRQVRGDLIRTVFNPQWEADLSESDRVLALKLALGALIPAELNGTPNLAEAHPAVVFAVLGSLPIDLKLGNTQDITVQRLTTLPAPFGKVFAELKPLGIYSGQDPSIRALCHLLQGKITESAVASYFDKAADDLVTFIKLRALVPLFAEQQELEEAVYLYLFTNSRLFARMMRWFDDEPLADWSKISRSERFLLLVGSMPERPFTFEQFADLLTFPSERIRSSARRELSAKYFSGKMVPLLAVLGGSENQLTRAQTISIVAAFLLTGHQADAFYTRWFSGGPDAGTVLAMLSSRSDAGSKDLFNYKAAEYLHKASWSAPLDVLKRLLAHPEPLARTLVYSRLDVNKPEELQILKTMATGDPSPLLRSFIQKRLSSTVRR
ncbi:MAG: protein kinase family protein [Deltaproteobacteria bacterium]|nr:protein kinase family protein [Deltaproteobacteria bacterium]